MSIQKKIAALMQPNDYKWCIAVPGSNSFIDVVNPETKKTAFFGKTLEDVRAERPEYAGAVLMLFDDFVAEKAARQHTPIEWIETTEKNYYEMLGCLPPAMMLDSAFLVGEPYDHDASNGQPRFQGFRANDDKYWISSRPMTRNEFREQIAAP